MSFLKNFSIQYEISQTGRQITATNRRVVAKNGINIASPPIYRGI
ncbi:hypothetical protein [Nostoc sp.]